MKPHAKGRRQWNREHGTWYMLHGYSLVRLVPAHCYVSWGRRQAPLTIILQCQLNPSEKKEGSREMQPIALLLNLTTVFPLLGKAGINLSKIFDYLRKTELLTKLYVLQVSK